MQSDLPSNYNLPPQNIEAEESILASFFVYHEINDEIIEQLKPEHFYRTSHKKIFSVIKSLFNEKSSIDLITVAERLKSLGHLEEIGGASYLANLTENIPISTSVEHHSKIIIDKAIKRFAIEKCNNIAKMCFEDVESATEVIDKAQESILSIESVNPETTSYKSIKDILGDSLDVLDERFLNKGKLTGIPTGFSQIDFLTWGLQNSDLIIIAARPSLGKSSISLNIVRHAAVDCDIPFPCGIFSMEMSTQQLAFKFLADLAKINTQKFKSGLFSQGDWVSLSNAAGKLAGAPIYIDDSSALTINEIRRRSRKLWKRHGIKLLVIDYIQLMSGIGNQNRNQDISDIANGLKNLAKELNIPIIAISQLNRKVEDRTDKHPHMADLRDSGAVEQAADVIAFVYRDEVYNKNENNPLKGIAEIIISKNRTGPTGTARLSFVDKYASFYPLANNDPMGY